MALEDNGAGLVDEQNVRDTIDAVLLAGVRFSSKIVLDAGPLFVFDVLDNLFHGLVAAQANYSYVASPVL